ncbi:MAG TPA: type II toxin-antitoxin system RelE/ParE family toxin [Bryobacteraceae bacterium]|nr:type II toxin-antitoxin system RelE/ParE family toxin [Bryobacteraceae bacterium]
MRTFKTKAFARFIDKAGIPDLVLCQAVRDAERGFNRVDLGGGVIKQRIARPGHGKSARISDADGVPGGRTSRVRPRLREERKGKHRERRACRA